MKPRQTVFVGSDPPTDRDFDWAVDPAAAVALGGSVSVPDIAVVKGLLDEAVPVIDALTDGTFESLLRDEFFQLVLSVARVEAMLRALDSSEVHAVVASRRLARPSRSGRIGAGLAGFLGADLEWTGGWRPQRFPAGLVGSGRAWRFVPLPLPMPVRRIPSKNRSPFNVSSEHRRKRCSFSGAPDSSDPTWSATP